MNKMYIIKSTKKTTHPKTGEPHVLTMYYKSTIMGMFNDMTAFPELATKYTTKRLANAAKKKAFGSSKHAEVVPIDKLKNE